MARRDAVDDMTAAPRGRTSHRLTGWMMMLLRERPIATATLVLLVLALGVMQPGCAPKEKVPAAGVGQADKWLFERGTEAMKSKKWLKAREYFRQLVDSYPQSPLRPDAKLGLGDTYLGEGTVEALVLGQNEFHEFLTFYPTSPRADYAQFKIGMVHFKQMAKPERDQTQTREAIAEFRTFLERYPNSSLTQEARSRYRECRDRLSQSEYGVGLFYFRSRWYPGAIDRFRTLLKSDPEFTYRDAVYFYLAESLVKTDKKADALPYFERVLSEFKTSDFLLQARKRIAELKAELTPGSVPRG